MRYAFALMLVGGCAAAQQATPDAAPEVDAADMPDVQLPDSRPADASMMVDARPADAALPDAAPPDAAPPDAAMPDAAPDAPPPPDAAIPDAAIDAPPPPDLRLDSIDPDNGLAGSTLTGAVLRGAGFTATTTLTIGGAAATNCSLLSATQLQCDLPAAPGGTPARADVIVTRGSDNATLIAGFTWTVASTDVTWCDVQWPATATATANNASPYIYGQIYQSGVTDTHGTAAPGIVAQLGWGPAASDPRSDNHWRFVAATPNPSWDFGQNNDEYYARVALPAGTYGYVFRFTLDGGLHFTYCDLDTANGGFDPAHEGTLTVTP